MYKKGKNDKQSLKTNKLKINFQTNTNKTKNINTKTKTLYLLNFHKS